MTRLDLCFLGPPEVQYGEQRLEFPTRKALALLAYLMVEGGRQPREKLATLLWPESPSDRVRATLRNCLLRLRKTVPDPYLISDPETIAFNFDAPHRLDLQLVEDLCTQSRLAPVSDAQTPDDPLSLIRGDFLEGFTVDNAPEFDNWLAVQREHWHRRVDLLFDRISRRQIEAGRRIRAEETLARWLAHNPLNEIPYRRLMRVQSAAGHRTAALQTYARCRDVLAAELGVAPSAETQALADRVRRHDEVTRRDDEKVASSPQFSAGPLVGREEEFQTLVQNYYAARREGLRVVCLVGEAGIGKSRLLADFLDWSGVQGGDVLRGRSYESGRQLPYAPLIEALRPRLERINAPDDLLADVWLVELSRLFPELRDRYPDLASPAQDESAARVRLFEAVVRLTLALAEEQPLVLAVDDLQWTDAASLDLLEYACRRWQESASPVLLALAVRAEALHPLSVAHAPQLANWLDGMDRSHPVVTCTLSRLTVNATTRFLSAYGTEDEQFARWLARETEGQPFYLVEVLRDLYERGLLAVTEMGTEAGRKRWRLVQRIVTEEHVRPEGTAVPERLRRTIATRLARLDPTAFDLLAASAVLAQGIAYELLCTVAGVDEVDGLAALDELLRSGLLHEAEGDVTAPYIFAHDKIRDVTYTEAGDARRRVFHKRALAALREKGAPAAQLAHHALAAGDTDAAVAHSIAAGDEALALFAVQDAIAHYEQALDCLASHASSLSDPQHLYLQLGRAHELAGDYDRALSVYGELQQIARARADERLELAALMARTTVYAAPTQHYDPESVQVLTEQALPLARALRDHEAEAKILWNLILLNIFTGNVQQAIADGEASLTIAREHDLRERIAYALHDLHRPYLAVGRMDEALAVIQEAQDLWRDLDNKAMLADNLTVLGGFHAVAGEYDESLALCEEALDLSRQIDNLWNQSFSQFTMTPVLFEQGEYAKTIATGEASIDRGVEAGFMIPTVMSAYVLAWAYGDLGDIERGLTWANSSLAQAEKISNSLRTGAHSALAYLYLLQGDLDAAAEAVEMGWSHLNPELNDFGLALLPIADCQVKLAGGMPREALEQTDQLLDLVRTRSVGMFRAEILLQRGRALLALKRVEEAVDVLRAARQKAEAMGARRPLWRILATLASAAEEQGDLAGAQGLRRQASACIHAIADAVADPVLRASFLNTAPVQSALAGTATNAED